MKKTSALLIAAVLLPALRPTLVLADEWTGNGSSINWSDTGNWESGSTPTSSSFLYFSDVFYPNAYTNAVGVVNSVINGNYTAGGMAFNSQSGGNFSSGSNHHYTVMIPSGVTLTIDGGASGFGGEPTFLVGQFALSTGGGTNYTTFKGGGTLNVNHPSGQMEVRQVSRATLDLSGLDHLTANIGQLQVGATTNANGAAGVLFLAKTNAVTTSANTSGPGILLGRSGGSSTASGQIFLGQQNTFNTDGLTVGGNRGNNSAPGSRLNFTTGVSDSTFAMRGTAGGGSRTANFTIGDISAQDGTFTALPGGSATGIADLGGGTVDIRAVNLYVGRSAPDTAGSPSGSFTDGNGTLIVEKGMVDVNNLYVGYKQGTNLSRGVGTLTLRSNAVMIVNSGVSLAYRYLLTNGSQAATATLNVNDNAVLNIGGNLTHGDGGISTINLAGGTIGLTGAGSVYAYGLGGSGSITNASGVTVTNNFGAGTGGTAGTLNIGGNLILANPFGLVFDLGADATVGGGVNDHVNIVGNLSVNNNAITLGFNGPLVSGGTYHLIDFSGSRSGAVTLINPTRSPLGLDQTTAGHIDLIATNWAPAALTWAGNSTSIAPSNNVWNAIDTNWNNGGSPDRFYQMDHVVFDDTATSTNIYPNGVLSPASITINGTKNFSITNRSSAGPYQGFIVGNTSITKNGTGTFLLGNQSNAFTGPIYLNNGILRPFDATFTTPGNNWVLGHPNAVMYVTNAGTFDINNIGSISSGKQIVIKGTGFNGMGTITNSGTAVATMNGYFISLDGDALIAAQNGGWGIRGLGSSGAPFYSGSLKLNGYTLTKVGTARFQMQEVVATDAGNINFGGGNLSLRNTLLTGAGTLTFSNNTYLQFQFLAGATSYVSKAISTIGAFGIVTPDSGSAVGQVTIDSPWNLGGALSLTNNQTLLLGGAISGAQDLIKYGSSNLVLNAGNLYSGSTLVTAGTLSLGAGGSVNNSPLITVSPGAALDVTAKAGNFALAAGQTLNLNGTVVGDLTAGANSTLLGSGVINGSLTVNSGSEVALATTNVPGITIISNNLTLAGGHFTWELAPSVELGDGLIVNGNLNLSGINTFTVNSIGGFDPSGTNTLITYTGTLSGGLPNLAVNTSARFVVEFVDPATTPGKIQIRLVTPSPLLTWKGGNTPNPLNWDVKTTANWDKGAPDVFWQSDLVRFDDAANTNVVNLVGTLGPASISMENSAVNYTFGGPGGLVSASLTNSAGNLTLTNAGNNFFTGDGLILNGGNITFAQPVNASLTANLRGGGVFNKGAGSTLTLTGSSASFGGQFNINAGTLRAGISNVLGTGPALVASGGTLDINGHFMTAQSSLSISGSGADGFGAINNRGSGRTNAVSNVNLTGDTMLGAISNAWGISGNLNGGGYTLTKTNANDVWIQTGSDTGLGEIDIRQGRLVFGQNGTTLGQPEKSIVIRPTGTFALAATNQMPQTGPATPGIAAGYKPVTLQSGGTFEGIGFSVNTTTVNSFDGPIAIATNASFKVGQNSQLVLNGPISGNGNIILTNNGLLMLNGTNTYSSNTFVYSGTLVLTNASALPTNTILAVSNLTSSFGNAAVSFDGEVVFSANSLMRVSSVSGLVSVGGNGTWNGPIFMQGGNTFTFSGGNTLLDLAGPLITTNVSGSGVAFHGSNTRVRGALSIPTVPVTIGVGDGLGAGFGERFTTVTFDSSNRWTTTTIDRGRVNLGTNNAIPVTSAIRVGTLSSGVADRRVIFDLAGYSQVISNITETAVGDSLVLFGNSSTNSDSLLTVTSATTNTWAIRIVDALDTPAIPHRTALTVTAGTLNLVGTNTYTGPTTITGGRLNVVQGSGLTAGFVGQLGGSPVSVSGTGILGGNGLVQDVINIGAGGTLAPGVSIGTLTATSALNLGAGSKCEFEVNLGTSTNDQVVGLSSMAYGGTLVITNVGTQPFTNGIVLKLFSASSYTAGAVTIQPASPGPALAWDTSSLAVDGTLKVVPGAPLISGIAVLPTGNFSFTLTGTAGQTYSVLASTNVALPMASWQVLTSGVLPASTYVFEDLTATNYPLRFYRTSRP